MEYLITITSLLVFAWVNYTLGFRIGYKKGATVVLDHWKNWLDKSEEE